MHVYVAFRPNEEQSMYVSEMCSTPTVRAESMTVVLVMVFYTNRATVSWNIHKGDFVHYVYACVMFWL